MTADGFNRGQPSLDLEPPERSGHDRPGPDEISEPPIPPEPKRSLREQWEDLAARLSATPLSVAGLAVACLALLAALAAMLMVPGSAPQPVSPETGERLMRMETQLSQLTPRIREIELELQRLPAAGQAATREQLSGIKDQIAALEENVRTLSAARRAAPAKAAPSKASAPAKPKAAAPAKAASGGNTTHKVQKGETLYGISRRYGVSMDDLRRWNKISGNNIMVGHTLVIRAKP